MRFASIPWGRTRRFSVIAVAVLSILAGAAACGQQVGEKSSATNDGRKADDPVIRRVDLPLYTAMKTAADQRKGFSLRDATSLNRYISPAHAKNFTACFEKQRPNLSAVDIFAVRRSEKCPLRIGDDTSPAKTPKVLGVSVRKAVDQLVAAGFAPDHISVDTIGEDGRKTNERNWSWEVCTQKPAAGTSFSADLKPKLTAKASCSGD